MVNRNVSIAAGAGCVLILLAALLSVVALAPADAQTAGVLTVTPSTVEVNEPFSISASGCPGPNPVGADYSVVFQVSYLPPPQLPGDPDPGSYSATLQSSAAGNELFVGTWSLPGDAPTLGGAYQVTAQCLGNELGSEFVWFDYQPVTMTLIDRGTVLATDATQITTGELFRATATGCPGANPVGADYRIEYLLEYLTPPQVVGGPLLGTFSQRYTVSGPRSDFAVDLVIPVGAPTVGGVYRLTAECWGNELGSDFLWHDRYDALLLTVDQGTAECDGVPVQIFIADGQAPTVGSDVVLGSPNPDVIDGLAGDDVICGGDGADVIIGGIGNDSLHGDQGNDVVRGNSGTDVIFGGPGNDRLLGGTGADTIDGGLGSDYIGGFGGPDVITGGPGDDTIFGGFGGDTIDGDGGDDVVFGLIGSDIIRGGGGDDVLQGNRGQDTIDGGLDHDVIHGGGGDDLLSGNAGDDQINGGRADDALSGGADVDTCVGNKENLADTADASCETIVAVP